MVYKIKEIRYQNSQRNILLQDENGPCPLLAASNALLLRGSIRLPSTCIRNGYADIEDVITLLANRALSHSTTVSTSSSNESDAVVVEDENSKHSQYQISELMEILPTLQYGLDINPKFTLGPTGYEYSQGIVTTFDSLGVDLIHGWLLDPQDDMTNHVVGKKSYNELMEMVVKASDAHLELERLEKEILQCRKEEEQREKEEDQKDKEEWVNVMEKESKEEEFVNVESLKISAEDDNNSEPMLKKEDKEEENKNNADDDKNDAPSEQPVTHTTEEKQPNTESNTNESNTKQPETPSTSSSSDHPKTKTSLTTLINQKQQMDELTTKSHIIQHFLEQTSHQLTYYGLETLHSYLNEEQICIFFRNNHFSTITKSDGKLYLLVTDLGYATVSSVVWERLDVIDGDTIYVDSFFEKVPRLSDYIASSNPTSTPTNSSNHEDETKAVMKIMQEQSSGEGEGEGQEKSSDHAYAMALQAHYQNQEQTKNDERIARQMYEEERYNEIQRRKQVQEEQQRKRQVEQDAKKGSGCVIS